MLYLLYGLTLIVDYKLKLNIAFDILLNSINIDLVQFLKIKK